MSQKTFMIEGVGEILVTKRRGTKYLRLSLNAKGQVRVSIPYWAPYSAGVVFASKRVEWIERHQRLVRPTEFKHGDRIGKHHTIKITVSPYTNLAARVSETDIVVSIPEVVDLELLQSAISKASERALKKQAQKLLPIRVKQLAQKYGYSYTGVSVKKLSSRWGSCSSQRQITLNYFLMQLPWELIDYVILHELVHTKHLNHSKRFWDELLSANPKARLYQKLIRDHKPIVRPIR